MRKSDDSSTELSRNTILDALFEKRGCKCIVCGRQLTPSIAVIEQIYPKTTGGNDDISNLQLTCIDCNAKIGSKEFLGYQFEAYITELLEAHPSYDLVKDYKSLGNWKSIPDVVFVHKMHKEKKRLLLKLRLLLHLQKLE